MTIIFFHGLGSSKKIINYIYNNKKYNKNGKFLLVSILQYFNHDSIVSFLQSVFVQPSHLFFNSTHFLIKSSGASLSSLNHIIILLIFLFISMQ
jgi:hypothetical protein